MSSLPVNTHLMLTLTRYLMLLISWWLLLTAFIYLHVLQLSCMWEDVRWLRQSMSVSMSSSSTLQARHKMLTAAAQLQVRSSKPAS